MTRWGTTHHRAARFNLEKIIFHILKKLKSLEVHGLCNDVAELLHTRLLAAEQCEEHKTLTWSSFSVLWNGLSASKDKDTLTPRDKLQCQLQALNFLLLLDPEIDNSSASKAPIYAQEVIWQFENSRALTKEDSIFLSEQAGHYDTAANLLDKVESNVKALPDCPYMALVLGRLAVKIHAALKTSGEFGQLLTECARALRSLSGVGDSEANAVLEACGLVVWAVESSHTKALNGTTLLAWFSFLEEHQECVAKVLKKNSLCQTENGRLQQILCFSLYQGFVFAYESMQASQLEDGAILDRVLLFCQASAAQMMKELQKLNNENMCTKAGQYSSSLKHFTH
ncbi:hypothetical protein WMY93_011225 [Mugilogobius chulae]|uniref:Uncharacterized protein n=1 Tax=Mugilogobius chulae TaxID=88201 RepID=A0AAW0PBZ9_9GOBI